MSNVFQVFDLLKEKICPKIIDKHDTISNMILVTRGGGGGGGTPRNIWWGCAAFFPKTLTLFKNKICDFPCSI